MSLAGPGVLALVAVAIVGLIWWLNEWHAGHRAALSPDADWAEATAETAGRRAFHAGERRRCEHTDARLRRAWLRGYDDEINVAMQTY